MINNKAEYDYPTQTVDIFPLGDVKLGKPLIPESRSRGLPPAYIGRVNHCIKIPFLLLLLLSVIFLIGYVIVYFIHWSIVSYLHLHVSIMLCLLLCILNAITSVMGLIILNRSIISSSKLCAFHISMMISITMHIFIVFQFTPEKSTKASESANRTHPMFPNEYWECVDCYHFTKYCSEVNTLGKLFWSTLFLLLLLLVAWKLSMSRGAYPVHPEASTSSKLRELRRKARKDELSSIYSMWMAQNKLEKPYAPHFPNRKSDQSLNGNGHSHIVDLGDESSQFHEHDNRSHNHGPLAKDEGKT